MRSDVEENIIWTYFAVQCSTTEGAQSTILIYTFPVMKQPKARGVVILLTYYAAAWQIFVTSLKFRKSLTIEWFPVMIFSKYVFYIFCAFRNKGTN